MAEPRQTVTHWGSYHAETEDGRLVGLRPVGDDPYPSPIGRSVVDAREAPSRLLTPMVRRGFLEDGPRKGGNRRGGEPFVRVSWDHALDLIARELARVKDEHGNQAIYGGSYGWASAGRFHHAQSQLSRFLNLFGGHTDKVNTYSFAAVEVLLPRVLGETVLEHGRTIPTWDEIAAHTELVVSFGGLPLKNTQINPGGVRRHLTREGLKSCRDAGVEFVSISPLREDAADLVDPERITLRPNTDTAVMLALAHTIVSEDRHDKDFLEACCVGFERFRPYLMGESDGQPKDAEWAAGIAGIEADTIRALARRIASKRTLITVMWSLQRADHGEQPCWMAVVLAAVAGQLGKVGGGVGIGYCGDHYMGTVQYAVPVAAMPKGTNPVRTHIPVARIADMLLNPGETIDYDGQRIAYPDIRLVYWCGGNPFHHHQDVNRLLRAWQEPETIIVHEPFCNPVARHADIVLPATLMVERNDFAAGRADAHLQAMHRVAAPPGEAWDDFAIFAALAERLGLAAEFTEGRSADEWLRYLYDLTQLRAAEVGVALPDFEAFWRTGSVEFPIPEGHHERPWQYQRLREDPEANPLSTPSGRVEIFSETIDRFGYDDCPGHPVWLEPIEWLGSPAAARFPLHMLSNQPKTRLHSQYDNGITSRESKIRGREPVTINPRDAAERGIVDGDVVRLFNDRGACLAGAIVSDGVAPGVVQIATGAWYDPLEPGAVGSLDRHGNPNLLTRDAGTSKLAQGPIAQTTLIDIERYDGEPPPITAFDYLQTSPNGAAA